MNGNEITIEVAKKIWDIAKISPEHGNALMDLLGEDKYCEVMDLATKKAN